MAGTSDIEWTEATWNPIAGCKIVSPGCTNCYAMRMAARLQAMGVGKYAGTTRKSGKRHVWTGKVNVDRLALAAPLIFELGQERLLGRLMPGGRILGSTMPIRSGISC